MLVIGLAVAAAPSTLGAAGDDLATSISSEGLVVTFELSLLDTRASGPGVTVPVVKEVRAGGVGVRPTERVVTPVAAADPGHAPWRHAVHVGAHIPLLPDDTVVLRTDTGGGSGVTSGLGGAARTLTFTGLTSAVPARDAAGGVGDAPATGATTPGVAHEPLPYRGPGHAGVPGTGTDAPAGAEDTATPAEGGSGDVRTAGAAVRGDATAAAALARTAAIAAAAVALPALAGWTLYSRIRGTQQLDNETRKAIYELIASDPGIGVQEISRRVGISYSTASYHLNRLQGAHMIVMSQDGNKLRYYKNGGAFNEEERRVLPLLKNREALRVLACILDAPGTYRAAIAERLGVTATTVNWHLRRLKSTGLLSEERVGRSAHLYVDHERLTRALVPLVQKLEDNDRELAEIARALMGGTSDGTGHASSALPA